MFMTLQQWTYVTLHSPIDFFWELAVSTEQITKDFFNYYSSLCGNDELRAYREFLIFNQQINKLIEFYVFNVEKYKEVYLRENPRILSVCGDNVWNIIGYCFKLDNNGTTVLVIKDRFLETYLELLDLSGATYDIDGSIVLEESASMLS